MKTVLSIAGSDPSSGAGIQIDIRVIHRLKLHPLSVITALTVQNTEGVFDILPLEAEFIQKQLLCLLEDVKIDAVKVSMVYSTDAVKVLSGVIKDYGLTNIVVDPVVVSSSGTLLQEPETLNTILDTLLPLATFVTPNTEEASLLSGIKIRTDKDMVKAAEKILSYGVKNVVIKGGHRADKDSTDLLYNASTERWFSSPRVKGDFHGTGCVFSAALACYLAYGRDPAEAVQLSKDFVHKAILRSYRLGRGMKVLGV